MCIPVMSSADAVLHHGRVFMESYANTKIFNTSSVVEDISKLNAADNDQHPSIGYGARYLFNFYQRSSYPPFFMGPDVQIHPVLPEPLGLVMKRGNKVSKEKCVAEPVHYRAWALPSVFELWAHLKAYGNRAFNQVVQRRATEREVGLCLHPAHFLGDSDCILSSFGGDPRLIQRSPDQIDSKGRYSQAKEANYRHQLSPERHVFLRVKVAFGSAMVLSGYYLYGYAFKKGRKVSVKAGAPYAILGIFNVLAGGLIAAHAYFSLIG